ncbi:hypothetical protein M5D96_013651, partial [Drosophila gunungcola]
QLLKSHRRSRTEKARAQIASLVLVAPFKSWRFSSAIVVGCLKFSLERAHCLAETNKQKKLKRKLRKLLENAILITFISRGHLSIFIYFFFGAINKYRRKFCWGLQKKAKFGACQSAGRADSQRQKRPN